MLAKKSPGPSRRTEVTKRFRYRSGGSNQDGATTVHIVTRLSAWGFGSAPWVRAIGGDRLTPVLNTLPAVSAKPRRMSARYAYTFFNGAVRE